MRRAPDESDALNVDQLNVASVALSHSKKFALQLETPAEVVRADTAHIHHPALSKMTQDRNAAAKEIYGLFVTWR
jgi:hypothetical protein